MHLCVDSARLRRSPEETRESVYPHCAHQQPSLTNKSLWHQVCTFRSSSGQASSASSWYVLRMRPASAVRLLAMFCLFLGICVGTARLRSHCRRVSLAALEGTSTTALFPAISLFFPWLKVSRSYYARRRKCSSFHVYSF